MSRILFVIIACTAITSISTAQTLFDQQVIRKIEVYIADPLWDYKMDTAKHGTDGYLKADFVKIDNQQFNDVGIKYKGNSSFDSTRKKNPLHIEFDTYSNQHYEGYKDLKLSNGYADPSNIREVLAYDMLQHYMHCPKSNFAQVYINGDYYGLYASSENIDKKFCADHFGSNQGSFVKCNPIINPSPATKSNLKYIDANPNSYSIFYEIKSNDGWPPLISLCDSVSNQNSLIANYVNIDRLIWMLAFNNALVNLDSYNGVFSQNYYMYRDNHMLYNPIIWDLNMCFGGFPFAGAGTSSMGTLNIAGLQQLATTNHQSDPNWPLINAILNNPQYKRMYHAHLKTIIQEQISNQQYKIKFNQLKALIDTAVASDQNLFFTYNQFLHSADSNYTQGSYMVPGLFSLMDQRATFLLATPELSAISPSISNIATGSTAPSFNSNVHITASISNSNSAYLGYRFDAQSPFTKIPLYDDGMHNDGAANDNIFGNSILMTHAQLQYYIYAENNDAGLFSPARAEHEYYSLTCELSLPTVGDIVINELLTSNVTNARDEYNDKEDWIELFNNSSKVVDLSGCMLSDSLSIPGMWIIPPGTFIEPGAFVIIWADNEMYEKPLHTNFKLNKTQDFLLLSDANGNLLDSTSVSQQLDDVSWGRYPNGTGSFQKMNTTFSAHNNNFPLSTQDTFSDGIVVYPNPTQDLLFVEASDEIAIRITSIDGRIVYTSSAKKTHQISTAHWQNGMYLIQSKNITRKICVLH